MFRLYIGAVALCSAACSTNPAPQTPDEDKVAVGYGAQAGDAVTGSVGSVTRKDIEQLQFTRIEDYIAARIPGVQVGRRGGSITLQMRGPNTILGVTGKRGWRIGKRFPLLRFPHSQSPR